MSDSSREIESSSQMRIEQLTAKDVVFGVVRVSCALDRYEYLPKLLPGSYASYLKD